MISHVSPSIHRHILKLLLLNGPMWEHEIRDAGRCEGFEENKPESYQVAVNRALRQMTASLIHDSKVWPKIVVVETKTAQGNKLISRFAISDVGMELILINSQERLFKNNIKNLVENMKEIADKHNTFPFALFGLAKRVADKDDIAFLQKVMEKYFSDHIKNFLFDSERKEQSVWELQHQTIKDIIRYKKIFHIKHPAPSILDLWFIEWFCQQDNDIAEKYFRLLGKYNIPLVEPLKTAMRQLMEYQQGQGQRISEKLERIGAG